MRTLRNRRRGKRTRKGGLIKKVQNEWTNVSGPSETQAVNEYRRMEEETMRLLASGCQSKDSNECLRDESGVLLAEYQKKCDAYQGYEDETTFSELLTIKDTIGELIRLRVQDSGRFPVKLTDDGEQKRKRKAHRDRIHYWSIIYTSMKQIFDTVRQKRYDTRMRTIKKDYESPEEALSGEYERLKDPLNDEQYKIIKDAYEQTVSLITMLEKEDSLMGNDNTDVIAALKARNVSKQELYEKAIEFPQRNARRIEIEREMKKIEELEERKMEELRLKIKELRFEEEEERQRQDREAQMITESISTMDREQQRQLKEEEAKEQLRRKSQSVQAKKAAEALAVEQAIQKSKEEEIMGKLKFLSSVSPLAMVSKESKDKMKQYDDQIKRILQNNLLKGEKLRQIKEITTRWKALLDEESERKAKKSATERAIATSPSVSKYDSVNDVYRWENIQDLIETLQDSELKQKLTNIDLQIDGLVNSEMDRVEMNQRVSLLMEQGELFILRDELIKSTRQIHDSEERASIMRSNLLLNELPELPIEEKNVEMKKILSEWESKASEANVMQTHRENLPPKLFQRLVRLKEERKLIDPEDPHLKIVNMHNGLIDKMIYREHQDIRRIEEQIVKWES